MYHIWEQKWSIFKSCLNLSSLFLVFNLADPENVLPQVKIDDKASDSIAPGTSLLKSNQPKPQGISILSWISFSNFACA